MKGVSLIMVMILALAIPLMASPIEPNSTVNSLGISTIQKEEVVESTTVHYERLAVAPARDRKTWLPLLDKSKSKVVDQPPAIKRISERNGGASRIIRSGER